jgi:hypothetical protein
MEQVVALRETLGEVPLTLSDLLWLPLLLPPLPLLLQARTRW